MSKVYAISKDGLRDNYNVSIDNVATILSTKPAELKDNTSKNVLIVTIDATHGGYRNQNKRFYTKEGMLKSYKSFITPFGKPGIYEHDNSTIPVGRAIGSEFIDTAVDDGSIDTPKCKIRLKASISDPTAIDALLTHRLLTVSVGSTPITPPLCNICNAAYAKDMFGYYPSCEHVVGQIYDGKECFTLIGEVGYNEFSFANAPADQSKTHYAGVVDMEWGVMDTVKDSLNGDGKPATTIKDSVTQSDEFITVDALTVLDECQGCDDEDSVELVWNSEDAAKAEELDIMFDQVLGIFLADKKLSSEARGKLKKSTFCGPNKTFPILDCSHAAIAKAMLNWPKVVAKYSSSVRARISSCVNGKAKSMSCPMSKKKTKDSVIVSSSFTDKDFHVLQELSAQFVSFHNMVHMVDMTVDVLKDNKHFIIKSKYFPIIDVNDYILLHDFLTAKYEIIKDKLLFRKIDGYLLSKGLDLDVMIEKANEATNIIQNTPETDSQIKVLTTEVNSLKQTISDSITTLNLTEASIIKEQSQHRNTIAKIAVMLKIRDKDETIKSYLDASETDKDNIFIGLVDAVLKQTTTSIEDAVFSTLNKKETSIDLVNGGHVELKDAGNTTLSATTDNREHVEDKHNSIDVKDVSVSTKVGSIFQKLVDRKVSK